jgi:molecular chaperone Hsp33
MRVDDSLQPFMLERAGVRGAVVRLGPAWREVASRQDYPLPLRAMLGEALAASALLTAHIKLQGALSLEFKSAGALRLLFTECTDGGRLRGLAHLHESAVLAPDAPLDLSAQPEALLAITLGSSEHGQRYQGLVGVQRASLAGTLQDYFEQSEQLPTRIVLAADDDVAAGLLLQQLPGSAVEDGDAWPRVGLLTDTLGAAELLALPAPQLLRRLYHEERPHLFAARALGFGCSCSRVRVEAMLRLLGRAEVEVALVARDGEIEVICEFCATRYTLDAVDAERVLAAAPSAPVSSTPH